MSENDIYDKYVLCPFYVRLTSEPSIHCEGVTNSSLCVTAFEGKNEARRWFRKKCCRKPGECSVYSGIMRAKYPEDSPPPPLSSRSMPEQNECCSGERL